MSALLYRDFTVLKKSGLVLLVMLGVVTIYSISQEAAMMLPMAFVIIPVILLGMLFGSDIQSNADAYILSGPIRRKTVVLSRYFLVWGIALVGALLAFVISLSGQKGADWVPKGILVPAMFFANSLLAAIQLPLIYKFGAGKAQLVSVGLYFFIFSAFSYLGSLQPEAWKMLFEWVRRLPANWMGALIFALALGMNALSFALSIWIYKKKEF